MATMAFDANYYLAQYQDVREAVAAGKITAEQHWKLYGCKEERNPNAEFNTAYYAAHNTDVVASGMNYLDHYLKYGSAEAVAGKRLPNSSWESIDLTKFDKAAYLSSNPDVKASGMDALQHYMLYGRFEASRDGTAKLTDGTVITPASPAGETYALTTGADNIIGTTGNDTITGVNNLQQTTFSAVDSIDGGAGIDTLKLELNAAYAGGVTIKNVEKLNVTSTGGTGVVDLNGVVGLTDVAVNAGIATSFNNLANVVNAQISNVNGLATTLQFANTAVAGANDKVTVTLNNVTNAARVQVDSVTALGAGVEEVDLVSTGSANSVTLASNDATITKVVVTGAQDMTLAMSALGGNPAVTATTIDASALTGKLNLSNLGIANHTVFGGSANDTFDFGGNFAAGDVVDGGAGTDTLAVTQAITATQWAGVKNVEAVKFTAAGFTQDASVLTGVNTFTVSGAGVETLNKLANNADITVAAATTTLTASLNDATGLSDALKVQLNPSSGATASFTLGTLSDVTGIEQINLVSNGSSNAIVNTITTDSVVAKHVVTGTGSLTITNPLSTSLFDATALTGNLTVSAATGGSNIQAGSGNDVLNGNTGIDVLVGGAGDDRIVQLTAGSTDTLKGGAGADTFAFIGADIATMLAVGAATPATLDKITDFVAGTDKIALVSLAANVAPSVTVGQTVTIATAADVTSLLAAIGNQVAASDNTTATSPSYSAATIVVQSGAAAGTYLFVNDITQAATATDMLVNITGVTGTITAADFVFA